jgi:hypothetical protein
MFVTFGCMSVVYMGSNMCFFQYWEISENDEIRHGMLCCSKKDNNIAAQPCKVNDNHKWVYEPVCTWNDTIFDIYVYTCSKLYTCNQPKSLFSHNNVFLALAQ